MPYYTLRRILNHYTENAHLQTRVTLHTFRRSCTTEMVRAGANLYHIKEMLGHETLDTLKHYTKLTIVDLKKTHHQCHPRERKKMNKNKYTDTLEKTGHKADSFETSLDHQDPSTWLKRVSQNHQAARHPAKKNPIIGFSPCQIFSTDF